MFETPNQGPKGPRERLCVVGAEALSDAELIAILLGTGAANTPVTVLAERLLSAFGGLEGLERQGIGSLGTYQGVGLSKAARLLAAFELGKRTCARPLVRGQALTSSSHVDQAMRPRLGQLINEQFFALPLDSKFRMLGALRIAVGGLNCCAVSPSDVFRTLMQEAAAAVIVVHNHPSGDPRPSPEDILFTRHLVEAGQLLGISVLDHVIIGKEGYYSFLDRGMLPPRAP
ncbi:MAG: DNA repair protein RadC [Myxococcales bacterium]|nr:DNA repair protein RadC [Myxococcales bacterium]